MSDALTVYGQRDQVKELADRVTKMLPSVRELGETGALALAQVSYSLGLNPFIGEIWAIPQKDRRSGRVVGFSIMAGIKGLRRAARKQAQEQGGIYPFYRPRFRMMTDEEKELADLGEKDKGLICELEIVLSPGHPWYQANGHERFIVEGVGIVRSYEKSKMETMQLVRKRAEADALKMAFDIPFGDGGEDFRLEAGYESGFLDNGADDAIEGQVTEVKEEEPALEAGVQQNGDHERPLEPEIIKALMVRKTAQDDGREPSRAQIGLAAGKGRELFAEMSDPDKRYHSVLRYLWDVTSTKDLTLAQIQAMLDWMLVDGSKTQKDDTGDYPLHPDAPEEAQRIVRLAMQEAGQMDMFGDSDDAEEDVPETDVSVSQGTFDDMTGTGQ